MNAYQWSLTTILYKSLKIIFKKRLLTHIITLWTIPMHRRVARDGLSHRLKLETIIAPNILRQCKAMANGSCRLSTSVLPDDGTYLDVLPCFAKEHFHLFRDWAVSRTTLGTSARTALRTITYIAIIIYMIYSLVSKFNFCNIFKFIYILFLITFGNDFRLASTRILQ